MNDFAPDRKYISLRSAEAGLPFSEAVLAGDTLYISGHLGLDPQTGKPGATAETEARLMLEGFKQSVEAGGMTLEDVVTLTIYCSDVGHYQVFNNVYRTYFREPFPARAFIGSGKLLFDARFEIQGIAVKRR